MTCLQASVTRLLDARSPDLAGHTERLGPLPLIDGQRLRQVVTESGLSGRGGAGFPTGRKLSAVASRGRSVVIANGAEGEPASAKDRLLLSTAPHLVLDGLQLAAKATGATTALVYAPRQVLRDTLEPALHERREAIDVTTVESPDTFLAGQESAVVAAVQGGRAIPTTSPPPVYERGVRGRPTLVANVETLGHLALIARYGPDWFRELGTPEEPGTRLVTISGAAANPGVFEVAGGCSLDHALSLAGGVTEPVQAVLIGGYHGGWVPYGPQTIDLALTRRALAPYGAAPGAGVIVVLPASACGLRAGADIAAYLASEGAQQCGPCRNGLPALAATLRRLAYERATPQLAAEVERISGLVQGRGACHHPAGTVRLVRSTMATFSAEATHHLNGWCTAHPSIPNQGRTV